MQLEWTASAASRKLSQQQSQNQQLRIVGGNKMKLRDIWATNQNVSSHSFPVEQLLMLLSNLRRVSLPKSSQTQHQPITK